MAHAAFCDQDMIVREVHVINNSDLPDDGAFTPEVEAAAQAWEEALGLVPDGWTVLLTSYNGNFRGRYAGIGYRYDAELDEFIAPAAPEVIEGEVVEP
jgi:hypothetical protein